MSRLDISPFLIHFTSGQDLEDAFRRLQAIVVERRLIGGGTMIKGGYHCVCFSEAPLVSLRGGLVNERYYSRYSPFGIMVSKEWLFSIGGRPVIYETDQEFAALSPSQRWRHMRYDIRPGYERIDYTWEREWRIQCSCLSLDPSVTQIVVPDTSWAGRLQAEHERDEDYKVMQYSTIMDSEEAEMYRNQFEWLVVALR